MEIRHEWIAGGASPMQYDGNFVLYDSDTNPVWATGTDGVGPNLHLIMQNDHNLVMYADEGGVLWASNTTSPAPSTVVSDTTKIRVSKQPTSTPS